MRKKTECLVKYRQYLKQKWIRDRRIEGEEMVNIPQEGSSVIYMIYSTRTKWIYVGETKNMEKRIETEMRNAYRSEGYKYKYRKSAFFEKRMGNMGVESWGYFTSLKI